MNDNERGRGFAAGTVAGPHTERGSMKRAVSSKRRGGDASPPITPPARVITGYAVMTERGLFWTGEAWSADRSIALIHSDEDKGYSRCRVLADELEGRFAEPLLVAWLDGSW